jgi:hypothetical protein
MCEMSSRYSLFWWPRVVAYIQGPLLHVTPVECVLAFKRNSQLLWQLGLKGGGTTLDRLKITRFVGHVNRANERVHLSLYWHGGLKAQDLAHGNLVPTRPGG